MKQRNISEDEVEDTLGDYAVNLEHTPAPLDGTMDLPLEDQVGADQQEMPA